MGDTKSCGRFEFLLLVSGKSESEHLPKLFKSLMRIGVCGFKVIGYFPQHNPPKEMPGLPVTETTQTVPRILEERISLPARNFLAADSCHFVLVVDDLEHNRRDQATQIFNLYRQAIDKLLSDKQKRRASVHFLVYMLEAYYFADAKAVNKVLSLTPELNDHDGDVEEIRHPKGELKKLYSSFHERDDGGKILEQLDVEHILSNPETCAGLRTLFAWCIKAIKQNPTYQDLIPPERYRLQDGKLSDLTKAQLDSL